MANSNLPETKDEQILEWIDEYQKTQDDKLKKKLASFIFVSYTPLIKKIVQSFARRASDPLEDLYQVASIGIIKAINSFDKKVTTNFKSYLTGMAMGEIKHYLRDKSAIIKAPRQVKELSYRIKKISDMLYRQNGQTPTDEEIAKALDIPEKKVIEAMDIERRTTPVSMEQVVNNENVGEEILDIDYVLKYKEEISNKDYKIILEEAINSLDETAKTIIQMSFFEDYSQAEIAKKMALSPMSISRKIKKALSELLIIIKQKGIEDYE